MKHMKRYLVILIVLLTTTMVQATIRVTNLSVEGRTDQPLGLDILQPRLGWQIIADHEQGVVQTQFHLQVASDRGLLEQNTPDLWEQEAGTDRSQNISYQGKALKYNQRCFWRVKITASYGDEANPQKIESDWSEISEWGVGLLNDSHWKGYWIGLDRANEWDVEDEHSRLSARYYRTQFKTTKEVKRATLHIAGLGLYEAYLNGQKVGNDVLTPAPTDYRKSIIYNTYDVTSHLSTSIEHSLQVTVSNGRYYTMQQNKKRYKITNFGYPTLRANLIIEYADGKIETIATDDKKWQMTCDGAIRSANEYDGEIYDARRENLSDEALWFKAERSAIPQGELLGNVTPAMRIVDTLQVKQTSHTTDNRLILDFGQNFAGWIRTDLSGLNLHKGDTLRVRYAEKIDSLGNLWVENLRHAQSTDYYIANGQDSGTWAPRFVYHGGRYAEIAILHADQQSTSPINDATLFIGEVVNDPMETLYTFECQNELLNRLVKNAFWGIRSNYKGMPIDCPQRDERQPWLGDHSQGCWGESYLMDNHHLYNKWMRDIKEAMRSDGCIPDVAPAFWNYYSDNASWPSVFVFGAEMLYRQYDDEKAIIDFYPSMRKWLLHLYNDKRQSNGLVKADKYADWCVTPESPELIHSQDPSRVTDGILIGSCYMYKMLEVMLDFNKVILSHYGIKILREQERQRLLPLAEKGYSQLLLQEDKVRFSEMRDSLRAAINREFLHIHEGTSLAPDHPLYPDSIFYANNAVTANLLPLAFGIVPEQYEDQICRQIQAKIMLNPADGHLCCGVIGISWLLRELSRRGRMDIAYLLATNRSFPSWGYMVEHGATTIWELWNGDTANPKMNSGNHIMLLGDLLPWCFEHIGGIQADRPGFKEIRLAPNFELEELSWAKVSYKTPYGKVVSHWKKTPMYLIWDIEIPANTHATIVTPNGERRYTSGKHHIEEILPHKEAQPEALTKGKKGGKQQVVATMISNEFLYESAPFPSCHAASIAECNNGDLLATYFGGSREGSPDVCIWTQRKRLLHRGSKGQPHTYEDGWSEPQLVADGTLTIEHGKSWREWAADQRHRCAREFMPYVGKADTLRKACYNPVLYQIPGGDLMLFYKVGKDVRDWTGYVMRSDDNGYSWSMMRDSIPAALPNLFPQLAGSSVNPDSLLGPIKNKPICLPAGFRCKDGSVLKQARILAPTSKETATATKIKAGRWRCYVEISEDEGKTWTLGPVVPAAKELKTIQPTLLIHSDGRLQMLCRTAQPPKDRKDLAHIATSFSDDGGLTWSEMTLIESLLNNNSGIDAVNLNSDPSHAPKENQFAVVYNPFGCVDWKDKSDPTRNKPLRTPLQIATSQNGLEWTPLMTLESSPIGQYSYPSMIVGSDGTLHIVYTWRRQRIKYQRVKQGYENPVSKRKH